MEIVKNTDEVQVEEGKKFTQEELQQKDLNELAKLYNAQLVALENAAVKMVPCMLSNDDFKVILKAISDVKLVQDDSVLLMHETLKPTIKELTEFTVNQPWTVRKVMLYDTLLGKNMTINNANAMKKFIAGFGNEVVKDALNVLAHEQKYLADLMQVIRYKEQMIQIEESRGIEEDSSDDMQTDCDNKVEE